MSQIFICYRRGDTQAITGRIAEWLMQRVPKQDVFIDVDLEYGIDFVRRIQETIPHCTAVLIVIGEHWIDEQGAISSFVRMEVELALEHRNKVKVIPVRADGAKMPPAELLPEKMRPLANLNAAEVRSGRDFTHDMEELSRSLDLPLAPQWGVAAAAPPPLVAAAPPSFAPAAPPPLVAAAPPTSTHSSPTRSLLLVAIPAVAVILTAVLLLLQLPGWFPTQRSPAAATATSSLLTPTTTSSLLTPQEVYVRVTSTPPLITDPLTGQDSNAWDVATSDPSSSCGFSAGGYHASVTHTDRTVECFANAASYGNFALQVTMTMVAGDAGGIAFRALETTGPRFRWAVYQDGHYDLAFAAGPFENSVIANGNSPYLKGGIGQANVLTVIAQGSALYLYANQQVVTTLTAPPAAPASGKIGGFAYDKTASTDVEFSNLRLWAL